MNLYLVQRLGEIDYDEYRSFIVCANSAKEAKRVHPGSSVAWSKVSYVDQFHYPIIGSEWPVSHPDQIEVVYLGKASPRFKKTTLIDESYNAG